jgi:hypothetical protein
MWPPTSATGTGWERTPWHATQRAAVTRMVRSNALAHPARCVTPAIESGIAHHVWSLEEIARLAA